MNTITNITNTTQLANAFKQLNASHYDLVDSLTNSVDSLKVFKVEVDTMYLLICGTLVVFSTYQLSTPPLINSKIYLSISTVQAGFAMLEAGTVVLRVAPN